MPPEPDVTADLRPSARDLVRKRSGTYRAPETGRHHHIGAAPDLQPQLGEDGATYVETAPAQLRERTPVQLEQLRERLSSRMARAAEALDFELAAALRDDIARVEQEQARRR